MIDKTDWFLIDMKFHILVDILINKEKDDYIKDI